MEHQIYRLARYRYAGRNRVGVAIGRKMLDLKQVLSAAAAEPGRTAVDIGPAPTMRSVLNRWPEIGAPLAAGAKHLLSNPDAVSGTGPVDLDAVDLLPPLPDPGKIINVGLNFFDHAREMGIPSLPDNFQPNFFSKGDRSAVIGPGQPIVLSSSFVDWEAELAVVIGKKATRVRAEEAMGYVAGFTCHNDVTDRGLMMKPDGSLDFFAGKCRDSFAPLGPFIVPLEQMPELGKVRIKCFLNGELMQDFGMDQIIWGPAECIAYISGIVTLMPGDVIGLGTGAGTGWARGITVGPGEMKKLIGHMYSGGGRFLRAGDGIAVEIEPIGRLENGVQRYE